MKLLKPGDSGIYVQYLTLALRRAGFDAGGISDNFNIRVYNALVAFQNSVGLAADGVAGEMTQNALLPYLLGYTTVTADDTDTFQSIARRFGTTADAIRIANPFVAENNVSAGTRLTVPFDFDVVADDVDYSFFITHTFADGIAARYPFVNKGDAGKSVRGNNLTFLSLGSGSREVFINASHHANEWITTPVVLKFFENCCKGIATGTKMQGTDLESLFATKTLFLMPLVNPDGVDLVTGALDTDDTDYVKARSIAAEYPSIPFPNGWKANILGTDLNLNYPAGWENAKQIKEEQGFTTPAPRDYVGTAPLSAVESRAVYNFTLQHDFALTLSYHTQGEVIYWKYLNIEPQNAESFGRVLATESGYALDETPYASGFAGYKDWYIAFYNRPGYTVEAGSGINPLPISDFAKIYPPNEKLMLNALVLA